MQMNISVPEELHDWMARVVAEGRYASESEYIQALLNEDRNSVEKLAWLKVEIEKGRNSGISSRSLQDIYDDFVSRRDAA